MFQWTELAIPLEGPREASLFIKLPLQRGLGRACQFAGGLTLLGAAGIFVPLILMPADLRGQMGLLGFGGLFFICFSLFFFQLAKGHYGQRLRFLQAGKLVKAQVLRQGTRFNPLSSTPHTTLTLVTESTEAAPSQEITGVLWKREAASTLKPGSEIWVLALPSEENTVYWCPFEAGLRLFPH